MLNTYIIDRNLTIDATGKITQFNLNSIESIKNLVDLYLQFSLREIPYSEFGNNLLEFIFKRLDDNLANDLVNKLITDLSDIYNIIIKNYSYTIDKNYRKLSIKITFADNTTQEFIYYTSDNVSNNGSSINRDISNTPESNNTVITLSQSGEDIIVTWEKSNTDNYEYSKTLQYRIYKSTSANINDLATIDTNGIIVMNYVTDISTYVVENLDPGVYYFNVLVKDTNGIKLLYTMNTITKI
jgi:hypothetical protein